MTDVLGYISVGVACEVEEEGEYIVKTILKGLPKLADNIDKYGEDRFYWNVNPRRSYRTFMSCNHYTGDYHDWTKEYSLVDEFLVTVDGLFDGYIKDVAKPFSKWLTRLAKRLCIGDMHIEVTDGKNSRIILEEPPFEIGPWNRLFVMNNDYIEELRAWRSSDRRFKAVER